MTREWRQTIFEQYEICRQNEEGMQLLKSCLPDDEDREFIGELEKLESLGRQKNS